MHFSSCWWAFSQFSKLHVAFYYCGFSLAWSASCDPCLHQTYYVFLIHITRLKLIVRLSNLYHLRTVHASYNTMYVFFTLLVLLMQTASTPVFSRAKRRSRHAFSRAFSCDSVPISPTWHLIRYLIINENSMFGRVGLALIDKRLREISRHMNVWFGGLSVILCGDFGQTCLENR